MSITASGVYTPNWNQCELGRFRTTYENPGNCIEATQSDALEDMSFVDGYLQYQMNSRSAGSGMIPIERRDLEPAAYDIVEGSGITLMWRRQVIPSCDMSRFVNSPGFITTVRVEFSREMSEGDSQVQFMLGLYPGFPCQCWPEGTSASVPFDQSSLLPGTYVRQAWNSRIRGRPSERFTFPSTACGLFLQVQVPSRGLVGIHRVEWYFQALE